MLTMMFKPLVVKVRPPLLVLCCSIVRAGDAIYVRVGDHDLTQKYGSPGAQVNTRL